jgi:hypothetical protein
MTIPHTFLVAPACRRQKSIASNRLAQIALTVTLLVAFLQYCFERTDLVRLVPVSLLISAAFLLLLTSPPKERRTLLASVIRPSALAIMAAVTLPPLISSLFRTEYYAFEYGIMMVVTLISIRILLSGMGFEGVLLSFFYATAAGILIVVGLTFGDLMAAVGSSRYAPFHLDPNRTGFFAVTAIPVQLWFATRRHRYYILLLSCLCVFLIVAASSRGSIGGLLIGSAFITSICIVRKARLRDFTISRNKLNGLLALILVIVVLAVTHSAMGDMGRYLWTKLALEDTHRGLDSGFTGRSSGWNTLLGVLPKTSWLIGNGYRTTDQDFDVPVDNGYFSTAYELGFFATLIVLGKYAFFICFATVVYVTNRYASGTCLPTLIFTLAIFLSNAFVHRVLLGYGEQASILTLFIFVSSPQDVLMALHSST